MKIVLWIGDGANHKALANKINVAFPIDGIIVETKKRSHKLTLTKLFDKITEKLFLPAIARSWWGMQQYYSNKFPVYPPAKLLQVENINDQTAYDLTQEITPDLIIVSGTRLVKEKMLSFKPTIGILNLHTGLSPYIKGGPNCTNWCIATKQFHLIGNTVMWIDQGIDTGNIVTTECTRFDGKESLLEIHIKVMEHAHDLYTRAIKKVAEGKRTEVDQKGITEGITYYSKQWGLKEKINLIRNLNQFRKSNINGEIEKLRRAVKTIGI
ncbi:hypothetical protein LK994_03620 [Ferruginibacter lapsinanis]|uniref:formyltransferase family protein n=1 Tax=Ferruginibacter lapsinanis TaxID=563172 RepID=UPI001E50AE10|nr:formyltransferase family protein [Ferruginibacter lapsinanis]UEG50558.1 hypothetical protein LK994_03620 [Ferruginibacter lapsinanis]